MDFIVTGIQRADSNASFPRNRLSGIPDKVKKDLL
jgi:hypothetical protein